MFLALNFFKKSIKHFLAETDPETTVFDARGKRKGPGMGGVTFAEIVDFNGQFTFFTFID